MGHVCRAARLPDRKPNGDRDGVGYVKSGARRGRTRRGLRCTACAMGWIWKWDMDHAIECGRAVPSNVRVHVRSRRGVWVSLWVLLYQLR